MRATSYVTRGTLLVMVCAFGIWMVQRHDSSIAGAKRAPKQENQTVRPAAGLVRSPALDTVRRRYGSSDVAFEPNHGQVDSAVKFLARGSGYSLYLTATGATLSFASHEQRARAVSEGGTATKGRPAKTASAPDFLRMSFVGANPNPEVRGSEQLPGRINYLVGSDDKRWHTDIPTYSRISYSSLYRGIDLAYYGTHGQLEYDFIVQPGADPGLIRLKYDGMKAVRLNPDGDLVLSFGRREITQKRPLIYQENRGRKEQIAGKYRMLAQNEVGLEVGSYDTTNALVIDPALVFSSVFGGTSAGGIPSAIALDANGNIYVTGTAAGPDFPTTPGAFQPTGPGGLNEMFVSKLSADGTHLLYSTYLGGQQVREVQDGLAIAVDSLGQAYVGGDTSALDFPTTASAFQTTAGSCPNPDGTYCDGFLTVLNASGSGLVYSTYVGGTDQDRVQGVALDPNGAVYLTGQTVSTDFPVTTGAFRTSIPPTLHSHNWVFLTKVDTSKSGAASLVYSTYVGGIQSDANAVAVDASGEAYIAGGVAADSVDFPTTPGVFQSKINALSAAFVTKMNAAGTALVYSTFIGGTIANPRLGQGSGPGSGGATATAVGIDSDGNTYVVGGTDSVDFPVTSGAFQSTLLGPASDAFVSKLNPSGAALVYSTFVGGNSETTLVANTIAIDAARDVYFTGNTAAFDFPTSAVTLQPDCAALFCGTAYVTELNPSGTSLVFSTFFGQSAQGKGIAVDPATGDIIVAGVGSVPKTPGAFSNGGGVFISRISPTAPGPAIAIAPAQLLVFDPQAIGSVTTQMATVTSRGNAPLAINSISPLTGVGTSFSQTNNCPASLAPAATCTFTFTFAPTQALNYSESLTITDNTIDGPHQIFLQGAGGTPLASLSATNLAFSSQVLNSTSPVQTITVTNNGSAVLQFTSINATGDFSQSNTCIGSSVGLGKSCTISVAFTPAASGARTGTITVVDDAQNSPQAISLSGTGVDFVVAASSSSATVNAGQSASYTLSITPSGGLNTAIALACSGAPKGASCSVSPNSVTPSGSGAVSATVTVSTTARSMLMPLRWIFPRRPLTVPVSLVWAMLAILLFLSAKLRVEKFGQRAGLVACLLVMILAVVAAGCGGGSSSGGSGGGSNPNGTPAGTYTLTVTATAGTATRTTTLQLIVN
jgi:Abnormal spindle-like microcephaly-assoc'd, ASPM-SPD-2-Hydin/Beta-propeller repeat